MIVEGLIETVNRERKTELVLLSDNRNAPPYIAEVLRPHSFLCIRNHGPGVMLQQDDARPHAARSTTEFVARSKVDVFP